MGTRVTPRRFQETDLYQNSETTTATRFSKHEWTRKIFTALLSSEFQNGKGSQVFQISVKRTDRRSKSVPQFASSECVVYCNDEHTQKAFEDLQHNQQPEPQPRSRDEIAQRVDQAQKEIYTGVDPKTGGVLYEGRAYLEVGLTPRPINQDVPMGPGDGTGPRSSFAQLPVENPSGERTDNKPPGISKESSEAKTH